MTTFGKWTYTCDRTATAQTYEQASTGNVDKCTCNGCRNFVLVRDEVFPAAFIELLQSLGIDPHKDGEIYHNGRLAQGRHDYAGLARLDRRLSRSRTRGRVHGVVVHWVGASDTAFKGEVTCAVGVSLD